MTPKSFGRYEIKAEIGRGGMAVVYLAHDPVFNRDVAVKILPAEMLHDPTFRVRFEREAKTIAALESQGIVPVYDYGEADGQPYFVMRLMTGGSLADRIRRGPMNLTEVIEIQTQIAIALDNAHAKGIIHRDLKPSNILFDQYGKAYLADFGLVKLTQSQQTATLTGAAVLGTPAYMSPEQAQGLAQIDGRSDIYSLGVILFEMLSGKVPFDGNTPVSQLMKHVTEPIPDLLSFRRDLPPGCQAVIARALAKNPDFRFSTAGELVATLKTVAQQPAPRRVERPPAAVPTVKAPPDIYATQVASQSSVIPGGPAGQSYPPPNRPLKTVLATQPVNPQMLPDQGYAGPVEPRRKIPVWVWILAALIILCGLGAVGGGGIYALTQLQSQKPTDTSQVIYLPTSTPVPTKTPTLQSSVTTTPTNTPTLIPSPTPTISLPPEVMGRFPNAVLVFQDDFLTLSRNDWSINGAFISQRDGILTLKQTLDWGWLLRSNRIINGSQALLALVKYDKPNVLAELIFQGGGDWNTPGYRRWGTYIGDNLAVNVFEGSRAMGGRFYQGSLTTMRPDTWYYVMIVLDYDSRFQLFIWERDNPSQLCSYELIFDDEWEGLDWQFSIGVHDGQMYVDLIDILDL